MPQVARTRVKPGTGGYEKYRSRHPGPGCAGRRRSWDQHGLYLLAAQLSRLFGASGSGLRGERLRFGELRAFLAALRSGEPAPGHFSRRIDGGWSDAAGKCIYEVGARIGYNIEQPSGVLILND